MKNFIFILLFLSLCSCSTKETPLLEEHDDFSESLITVPDTSLCVTLTTVQSISKTFNLFKSRSLDKIVESIKPIKNDSGSTIMYVINYADDGGFLIVSGTKDYYPIIAYSEIGHFDVSNLKNSAAISWFNSKVNLLSHVETLSDSIKLKFRAKWTDYGASTESVDKSISRSSSDVYQLIQTNIINWKSQGYTVYRLSDYKTTDEFASLPLEVQNNLLEMPKAYANPNYGGIEEVSYVLKKDASKVESVSPLTVTTWGQKNGYNAYTPNNYPVGCAVVAMGQAMRYHKFPTTFNWSSMANSYATDTTAYFLAELGARIGVQYGTETKASLNSVYEALKYYGYTSCSVVSHSVTSTMSELRKSRPVLMSGVDGNVGHAWICDGFKYGKSGTEIKLMTLEDCPSGYEPTCFTNPYSYDNTTGIDDYLFHMNWGWYGDENGYFVDDELSVTLSDGVFDFSTDRNDIIYIYPVQ